MQVFDPETFQSLATSPYAMLALSLLSFSESSFFIIPPELLLIPMALTTPSMAIILGILTSLTSIAGAFFGYWIGDKGGKPILNKLFKEESIEKVKILFHKYDAWAILIAAFTPIPFKLSTIAAGVFDLDLKRFAIASAIGRSSRYMLIALLLFLYGEPIRKFIEEDLGLFMLYATVAVIALYIFKKLLVPYLEKRFLKFSIFDRLKLLLKKK